MFYRIIVDMSGTHALTLPSYPPFHITKKTNIDYKYDGLCYY
jgi:hypothetical protein